TPVSSACIHAIGKAAIHRRRRGNKPEPLPALRCMLCAKRFRIGLPAPDHRYLSRRDSLTDQSFGNRQKGRAAASWAFIDDQKLSSFRLTPLNPLDLFLREISSP